MIRPECFALGKMCQPNDSKGGLDIRPVFHRAKRIFHLTRNRLPIQILSVELQAFHCQLTYIHKLNWYIVVES